jgi:hypothetical protein
MGCALREIRRFRSCIRNSTATVASISLSVCDLFQLGLLVTEKEML